MTNATPAEDTAALRELLTRYFAAIDDHTLDSGILDAVFADDAQLVRPNGSAMTGPAEILAGQTRSFTRFRATHHVSSDHIVDLAGDTDTAGTKARVRANLVATHLWAHDDAEPQIADPNSLRDYFIAGGVLHAHARRTKVGWRLTRLELRNTWRTGSGFGAMANTGTGTA